MFISITFRGTIIDETNKTQQKVRGSKFTFKMSTIYANTCIQTNMLLRNRCYDDGVAMQLPLPQQIDVLSTFNVLSTHIMDPQAVDPLLKHTPTGFKSGELGGHISGGINSGVSLCSMVTVSRARCAGAPILLKNVVFPENRADIQQKHI